MLYPIYLGQNTCTVWHQIILISNQCVTEKYRRGVIWWWQCKAWDKYKITKSSLHCKTTEPVQHQQATFQPSTYPAHGLGLLTSGSTGILAGPSILFKGNFLYVHNTVILLGTLRTFILIQQGYNNNWYKNFLLLLTGINLVMHTCRSFLCSQK